MGHEGFRYFRFKLKFFSPECNNLTQLVILGVPMIFTRTFLNASSSGCHCGDTYTSSETLVNSTCKISTQVTDTLYSCVVIYKQASSEVNTFYPVGKDDRSVTPTRRGTSLRGTTSVLGGYRT